MPRESVVAQLRFLMPGLLKASIQTWTSGGGSIAFVMHVVQSCLTRVVKQIEQTESLSREVRSDNVEICCARLTRSQNRRAVRHGALPESADLIPTDCLGANDSAAHLPSQV